MWAYTPGNGDLKMGKGRGDRRCRSTKEQKNVEWGAWGACGVWKKKFNTKDQVGNKENNT